MRIATRTAGPVTRKSPTLYARGVSRPSSQDRSPTLGLLLGLFITLSAVVAYSAYITWQVTGLRHLQTEHGRSQPQRFSAVASNSERSQPAGRGHARHGQQ
jgi:hypothetical protein